MPSDVMGVLNVTPDSFSDGGLWLSHEAAIAHGMQMIAEGASVIDVGGESTRPGAAPVSIEEETARVVPVVEALAPHVRVSIDTTKAEVARAAIASGASIINDVSSSLAEVAASEGAAWIAMHMQGDPRTMQQNPIYSDVVAEVSEFLLQKAERAKDLGVHEVWIDPGIGFGKTVEHNLSLLKHLEVLTSTPFPVLVGASRKSFLGAVAGDTEVVPVEERLEASLACVAIAITKGVAMVRVHDVKQTVQVVRVAQRVEEAR